MNGMTLPGTESFRRHPSKYSYITPYGYQSGSCGYCKDPESSQRTPSSRGSYYVSTDRLTATHYQALVDRGWRRSGTIMYLPDPQRSCCPHYTIRLPTDRFKPTKDQRQAVNRWNRHILGPKYAHEAAKRQPKSREEKKREQTGGFDFVKAVHEPEHDRLVQGVEPGLKYEVRLEDDDFTEEKYKLFEQYQREVHHESPSQISRNGFKRFLCSSPIPKETRLRSIPATGTPDSHGSAETHESPDQVPNEREVKQKLGSYHQTHWLNGKLIAMSVLDLLPHGVSAVYFIYDVSLSQYSLGKVSALRECALALEGGHEYYYMGYYIHSCAKMRYKNDFRPQYFLDWESLDFTPLDENARALLDEKKYVSMSSEHSREKGRESDTLEYKTVAEAESAGVNLYQLQLPGLTPLEELLRQVKPDEILASAKLPGGQVSASKPKGVVLPVTFLGGWERQAGDDIDLSDASSLVTIITELCAAVGPTVAQEMVVNFGGGVVEN